MTYTLDEQYIEVQREIAMRRRCYPRWVSQNTLTQEKAESQLGLMLEVLETIRKARQTEKMKSQFTGERIDAQGDLLFDGHTTLADAERLAEECHELAEECANACHDDTAGRLSAAGAVIGMLVAKLRGVTK